jgi:hypothetical protein
MFAHNKLNAYHSHLISLQIYSSEILSDLSILAHLKELAISTIPVINLYEQVFEKSWSRQLKWLKVFYFQTFYSMWLVKIQLFSYNNNQYLLHHLY